MTQPRHPTGVRTRLLIVVVVSVAIALTVMIVGFDLLLRHSLSSDADTVVRSRASTEAASIDIVHSRVEVPDQPDAGGLETGAWVLQNDRIVEKPSVGAALDAAALNAAATPGVLVDVPGRHTRLYAMPAGDAPGVLVVAGVSLAPYERTARLALYGSLVAGGLLLLVVAVVTRWILRRALDPVARMTADAESWSEHDPERRFAAGAPYDELSQLAATLDGLLARLSAGLRREQRFSAEMSHELRTPLARIQGEADLALRRERLPEEYRAALTTIARDARQMGATIETLMVASQQESGLSRGRCDVGLVLARSAESHGLQPDDRGPRLEVSGPGASLTVGVDADVVDRILSPLLENASRFARSKIAVGTRREGPWVLVLIDDDGPGVRADEAESIFEPGRQGTAAAGDGRDRALAGAGLGLALARRLARASGGEVTATAGPGGRFVVRLPVA